MISLELEKFVLNEGKKVLNRRYTIMLKRAEKELEWLTVNFPKAEMIIDHLRSIINGYRSILATVAALGSAKTVSAVHISPETEAVKALMSIPSELGVIKVLNPAETQPETKPIPKTPPETKSRKPTANGKIGPKELTFILNNHEKMNPSQIGKALGVHSTSIIYHLKKFGLRDSLANHVPGGSND